ncbi:sugar transporter family protein [Heterostelium album PN500]|uniref:Sugar transporter family protein n=1 Tax=Heterostelium pallidum (strain ATCC 26659 / Pp 5 / PN500) TaxID=670386 RepID=D3BQB6_HETP5|nr:sugar transporter family protein [Heterostelium album PN500]EFA76336.1 sugar transporter family protein [Heterostelium album PN500]|eukprot:XP_020428468.1 sugar transporter family protein [Heterostelium album PN500]
MLREGIIVGSDTPILESMDDNEVQIGEVQSLLLSDDNNNNNTVGSINEYYNTSGNSYQWVQHQNSHNQIIDPNLLGYGGLNSDNNNYNNNNNNNNNGNNSPVIVSNTSKSTARSQWLLFFTTSLAVLSTLEFGYNTGVISPTMPTMQSIFKFTTSEKSALVSIILVGAMVGSIGSGIFVDRIGRKNTLLLNNLLYISGPLLTAFSTNFSMLMVGRIITGISVGIASTVVPTYISEIAPQHMRGSLGLLRQSTITLGIMVSSLVAYGLIHQDNGWRYTFGISTIPSILQMAFFFWFLETPRWLVSKNRVNDAFLTMKRLDSSLSTEAVNAQIQKIKNNVYEQQGSEGWTQLLKNTTILEGAGFDKDTSVLISALVGIPQMIMLLISVWLIDRFGRRPLLLFGLIGQIVGLGVLGGAFWGYGDHPLHSTSRGWLAVAGMVFFKLMFSVGLGPIPLIIASEIYPSKIRGKAVSIASMLNWLANFIVNISFLHLLNAIGQTFTYWMFGGVSFLCFVFVFFFVPETKGVSIEELSKRLVKE